MEIKEKLLQSFECNKKDVISWHEAVKKDKYKGIDYKLGLAKSYGKCSILACILKQDFDVNVMDVLFNELKPLYEEMF